MKIYDINDNLIEQPDYSLGRLRDDKLFIAHHDAIEAVEEKWHYEVIAEYPNGGKDVKKVIDVKGIEAKDAWDEYEDILRFIPYTEEELIQIEEEKNRPTPEERLTALESALLELILGGSI